jgi:thiamine pyrophosphate-dependent acetolactate synthase large subunit-like protein
VTAVAESFVAQTPHIVVVGAAPESHQQSLRLRVDAKLVHIHADASELGRNHAPDAGIVGDCAAGSASSPTASRTFASTASRGSSTCGMRSARGGTSIVRR